MSNFYLEGEDDDQPPDDTDTPSDSSVQPYITIRGSESQKK